jgi:RNA polymerase sigma-70 factor, ECF subfamily
MVDKTDEELASAVQGGDIELFGELILRYEAKLKRYARKFLRSNDEIEDLVQDVFIKTYTGIRSFDTTQRFSPWIYRIAHNLFVNELKRKSRAGMSFFDTDAILPFLAATETADADHLRKEVAEHIDTLLESLSPKYREVIVLHYIEGLSYQEISEIIKVPINTVGVRLLRGRKQLEEVYEKHKRYYA